MRRGEVYVTPDDSVETLRKVMTEHDWGQVPVLDPHTGAMLGIVTRTDLIKQWAGASASRPRALDQPHGGKRCRRRCSTCSGRPARWPANWAFPCTRSAASCAICCWGSPTSTSIWWSKETRSGWPRRWPSGLGGRVRSHRRFGTAKWILPEIRFS